MPELNARYRAKHGHGPSGPREPASALCFHGDDADVTVVSKSDRFQFNPSFIWIPFGKRKAKDVVFPVAKTFESHGVEFVRRRGYVDRSESEEGRNLAWRVRL